MKTRTGIFGGSFNPVHTGHIMVAQDAIKHFGLAEILFIPCNKPAHKKGDLAPAFHRLAMLEQAMQGNPAFKISDVDIRRGGTTYSIDTVRDLVREFPESDFFFIIGSDTLGELYLWHAIDELLRLCRFAVMIRPGFEPGNMPENMGLSPAWRESLLENTAKGRQADISSSDIRRRIAEGMKINGQVPPEVETYIAKHGLYRIL